MDYDETEPLERQPMVSQESTCEECDGVLFAIGAFFACQTEACSRFAVPVNEFGLTDAEQERADASSEGQADGGGGSNYYGSEAMDTAQRIGQ